MSKVRVDEDIRPLSEFRAEVASFIKHIHETRRPMVLTQRGRGVAVLIDVHEFERMQELAAEDPHVRWLQFEANCGQSAALDAGFRAARGDYVAMIDADMQNDPADLPGALGWELRDVVKIRFKPKNDDHPYHHKDLYIDKQTLTALYSFAYDQKQDLWKIIWHNKRWSEESADERSRRLRLAT